MLDDEARREHARKVAVEFSIDPRLEPLIPLPQKSKKRVAEYETLIAGLRELSAQDEPQRTQSIEQLMGLLNLDR